jgi:putative peptidoglycan lipid II flippase
MTLMTRSRGADALARAALLTVVITLSGSVLGLVRDLWLARFFGASGGTDAFLVSWTVPETAFPLVVEGVMSFVMVPLLSRAIARNEPGAGQVAAGPGAAVHEVLAATMPRIVALLAAGSAAVYVFASQFVHVIAPGLADPALAVTCTRWTSVTVLTFGVAGYLNAALRAHHVFGAPASIHLAYNIGILALIWSLHGRYGVVAAAAGVALGSVLMVAAQVPSFLRHVGLPRLLLVRALLVRANPLAIGVVAPVVVYTLSRQAQVLVERFLGSTLPAGTISHLNYAQKVAQLPVLVALLLATVTFPTLARSVAAGQVEQARRRLEADLRTVAALVLVSAACLVALAPAVVRVLLEHGAFTAADTAATAAIVRVYAVGLLGQAMVGVLCRPFFTGTRPAWYPAAAMGSGLALTVAVAVAAAPVFGGPGIAAANAAGITLTAALLLAGLKRRTVAVSLSTVAGALVRLAASATGAALLGWLTGTALAGRPSIVVSALGGLVVLGSFLGLAHLTGARVSWRLR